MIQRLLLFFLACGFAFAQLPVGVIPNSDGATFRANINSNFSYLQTNKAKIGACALGTYTVQTTSSGVVCLGVDWSTITGIPPTSAGILVVGSGNLASTALVTGGGAQLAQTPSATATLDSAGNISTPGNLTALSLVMPVGTPIEVVGACKTPASVATPAVNEYALFLDSTNTCTLSRMSNARTVTVITGGTTTAGAPYTQSFTSQTTVALAHNLGLSPVTAFNLQCFNGSGAQIEYGSATATNLNTVTVVFAVAQTGSCTVLTGR